MKRKLARRFPTDREEYTEAKAEFVQKVTARLSRCTRVVRRILNPAGDG